eukprot:CAMPEP_0185154958 /NCGR_PEP_ID=MMETSP1139-20130426/120_1 /TAXON_ID=298111 /ORGANISM="Pavlova sp., Strain CCMP459" /LENGTH=46 /DNA_ID= /DNA_START= /DNA_END= /DNA_ORIENTATION=
MTDWFEPSSPLWCSSSGAHGVPAFLKATTPKHASRSWKMVHFAHRR